MKIADPPAQISLTRVSHSARTGWNRVPRLAISLVSPREKAAHSEAGEFFDPGQF